MNYVVYVNNPTSKAKVHDTTCPEYITRLSDKTENGYWSKPFKIFDEALAYANETHKVHIGTCSKCI